MEFNLTRANYLTFSWKYGIRLVKSVYLGDQDHGGFLNFRKEAPTYYFNFHSKECGTSLPEINGIIRKHHNVQASRFVENILVKAGSDLRFSPQHGPKKHWSFVCQVFNDKSKMINVEYLDIDPFWEKIHESDISGLIKKSHWSWYEF